MKPLILTFLLFFCIYLPAQIVEIEDQEVVCGADITAQPGFIPAPDLVLRNAPRSRFEFIYSDDVPRGAKPAIEYAGKIWGSFLISEVPIKVEVRWIDFESSTALGSARPSGHVRLSNLGPDSKALLPIALAESFLGVEIDNDIEGVDIIISIHNRNDWYFQTDGKVPLGRYDLVTVMCHEIGHGLGFADSSSGGEGGIGGLGLTPRIYDTFLTAVDGTYLTDTLLYKNPSSKLFEQFTSNRVFFAAPLVVTANGGDRFRLYAPSRYNSSSSISHVMVLDRNSDNLGDALMEPFIPQQRVIHRPGIITLSILAAMGWQIDFQGIVTSTSSIIKQEVLLFPNPAVDQLQIQWPAELPTQVQYQVTDISERLIQAGQIAQDQTLPLTNLNPGHYHLRLQSHKTLYYGKFVVSRN